MNNIKNSLINLFSNNFRYKKLGNFIKISMCKRILKSQTNTIEGVPFFKIGTIGSKEDSYITKDLFKILKDKYKYPKKGEILLTCSGTIGNIYKFDGRDSYFQDSNIVWLENDETLVTNNYLYYFFQNYNWEIKQNSTIKRIYNKDLEEILIPIPPIEVQNKIVEVLDKFTNYKAELTAELTARKEQYKYYRDILFNNTNKNSNHKYLWEVTKWNKSFNSINKSKQKEKINIKSVSSKELKNLVIENGNVRLISTGKFDGYTNQQIAKDKINKGEVILLPEGGSANLKYHNGQFVNALNLVCSSINPNFYSLKYIYYYLLSNIEYIKSCYRGSGVKHPDMREILDIKIPVPPIDVQNKIVKILDKFNSLINDISDGLPKEIELRNKQYEYYRDLLLDFGEKNE